MVEVFFSEMNPASEWPVTVVAMVRIGVLLKRGLVAAKRQEVVRSEAMLAEWSFVCLGENVGYSSRGS